MNHQEPPRWMLQFFQWFCREDLFEAISGDLLVQYYERASRMSRARNNGLFIGQVLTFFQPFAWRRPHTLSNHSIMFTNHLKVGFRLIRRNPVYSSINILGFAIGLSAVMLIALFIQQELSFDKFHSRGDDIVRFTYRLETPNATREGAKLPFPMKSVLEADYPEVRNVARFYFWGGDAPLLSYGNQKHTEEKLYFSENEVFQVFDFEFLAGNPSTALTEVKSIILTESLARKYFGTDDPMGKIMTYKNEDDLLVTGVIKDIPSNSHISFDALLPIELQRQRWMGWGQYTYDLEKDWNWAGAWVYGLLNPKTDNLAFEQKLQSIAEEHLNTDDQKGFTIEIQSLLDIHLRSDKSAEPGPNGNLTLVYAFAVVACLILLIACINFINLTTAQANKRLKEINIRQVMGAGRTNLVGQFLTESMILVSFSCIAAWLFAFLFMPFFNDFMGSSLSLGTQQVWLILAVCIVAFFLAAFSGVRPSVAIARLRAFQQMQPVRSSGLFNKILIVGQFAICNVLIIGIFVIEGQLDLLRHKDLGFDKEQMLVLRHGRNLSADQFEVFQNEINALPQVENLHRGYVAGTAAYTNTFQRVGAGSQDAYSLGIKWVGEGFTDMFEIDLVEGRSINPESIADIRESILINESAAKALGWSNSESIGKQLSFLPGGASEPEEIRIVGVMADANFESLYDPVLPSVFRMPQSALGSEVSLKLSPKGDLMRTITQIEAAWDLAIPEWPFEFNFLDQSIQEQYVREENLAAAIRYFAILAILIACSGLFGLSMFTIQQKRKEIGVRKVLGATVSSIFVLLSSRFMRLIVFSFLFAIPTGLYLSSNWLESFAFRISLDPMIFVWSGLISSMMVLMAIGLQSLKAAISDPVDSLRYE
ncbi:MAG: ABC transporter permease [Cytophagales bacterium]|nr:ABC transporter permease [Cytophagales bacterium]